MPLVATLIGRVGFRYSDNDLGSVSRKGTALLAYLSLRREGARREDLAELLWGPGRLANLRQELYALRQLPGASEWLDDKGDVIRVVANTDVQAIDEPKGGDALRPIATGELLPGLERVASPAFLDWLEIERRRVAELTLRATRALADELSRSGRHAEALAAIDAALAVEPLEERMVRYGMRAAYAAGDVRGALRRFADFRDSLRVEMGLDPADETLELEGLIRRGEPLPLPDDLRKLEPKLRGLAQAVAVADGALDVESLALVLERLPLDVAGDLGRLESAGLLRPDLTLSPGAKQAVLGSTSAVVLRLLHQRIAVSLRSSARAGPEVIARHLMGAGEANEAAPLLLEAAELAVAATKPGAAVPHLLRALWTGENDSEVRLRAALLLEGCASQLGEVGLQDAALAEAEALAWRLQSDVGLAEVRMRRSRTLLRRGRAGEGLENALEALEIATRLEDEKLMARARNAVGGAQFYLGDLDGAEESFLKNADVADPVERYRSRNNLGSIAGIRGRPHEALAHLEVALTLGRAAGEHAGVVGTLNNLAATAERVGDYRRALKHFKESLKLARQAGSEALQGQVLINMSVLYSRLGELGPAWNTAVEVEEMAEELGDPRLSLLALEQLAEVANLCGEHRDAMAYLTSAGHLAAEIGDERKSACVAAGLLVVKALMSGEHIEDAGQRLLELSDPHIADVESWLWLDLALATDSPEVCAELAERAAACGSESEHLRTLVLMAKLRAGLLAGASDVRVRTAAASAKELADALVDLEIQQAPHARLLLDCHSARGPESDGHVLANARSEIAQMLGSQSEGLPRKLASALLERPSRWLRGIATTDVDAGLTPPR
ncbi:MAG TPA: tetratricopeptide repeat protein [Trueperaceae bacterium]|nr:tetratricopeptide repeat protein [Trueperaceae bacterium]